MRARDGVVALVAFTTALLSLRRGGEITLVHLWQLESSINFHLNEEYDIFQSSIHQPQIAVSIPIISDIDGDGLNDITLIDSRNIITVLKTSFGRHPEIVRKIDTSIASEDSNGTLMPVAIAVGKLKQSDIAKHIIVVRQDMAVSCYNAELELKWRRFILNEELKNYQISEIDVVLFPTPNSNGIIVVGGSMRHIIPSKTSSLSIESLFYENEKNEEAINYEELVHDNAIHFSLYALDGSDGAIIWTHKNTNSTNENPLHESSVRSQYKLSRIERYHGDRDAYGSWHSYEKSLLQALPHRWDTPLNTIIAPIRLERQRSNIKSFKKRRHRRKGKPIFDQVSQLDQPENVVPNAIVVHLKHGIEVFSLDHGKPICYLPLQQGYISADINNDGIIDHVIAYDGSSTKPSHQNHADNQYCTLTALSGVPPIDPLFSLPICSTRQKKTHRHSSRQSKLIDNSMDIKKKSSSSLLVPIQSKSSNQIVAYDIIVAMSDGTISSYTATGKLNWQTELGPLWHPNGGFGFLHLIRLKSPIGSEIALIIAGESSLFVLSLQGEIAGQLKIIEPPVFPLIIDDFDGDGFDDVLLVGVDHIVAYQIRSGIGSKNWFIFACLLVVFVVVLFATLKQRGSDGSFRRLKRSTD